MDKKILLATVEYLAKKQNPDQEDLKNEKRAWNRLVELGVKNKNEIPTRLASVDLISEEEKAAKEEAERKAKEEEAEKAEQERLAAEKANSEGNQGNEKPEEPKPETATPKKKTTTTKKAATSK